MSYDVHIERDPPLKLHEWKTALKETEGVRLDIAAITSIKNPVSNEVITVTNVDGDAQVLIGGSWTTCFRWRHGGSVVFRASQQFSHPHDKLRNIARVLASKLNAQLVGDEGERYD